MTRQEPPSPILVFFGWILCFPCFARDYRRRNPPYRPWKPKPLRQRVRKLSVGNQESSSIRYVKQDQSFLFKLPPEVLLMVYEEILGGQTFHIFLHPSKKLRHVRCWDTDKGQHDNCFGIPKPEGRLERFVYTGLRGHAKGRSAWDSFDGDMIPFLQTCHRIYSEAISIMYAANTFSFNDGFCGPAQFSAVILPQRLQTLTSVRMSFLFLEGEDLSPTKQDQYDRWQSQIAVLQRMSNLRVLIIKVQRHNFLPNMASEHDVLAPLVNLQAIENFEVNLAWERKPNDLTEEHWPFRITRNEHEL